MVIILVFVLFFLEDKVVYGSENVESKRHLQDVKEDNQNYYFKMSDAEIDKFLIKVKNLQKGTDIKEVIDCLGEPFSNYEIRSKKWTDPSTGRCLTYYLRMWRKNSVNEGKDIYVLIIIDTNNKLEKVIIKNR